MTRRLEGKVALVTGAGCVGPGWGNGRAIAVRFAQEGARVFAVDKDLSTMTETLALIAEAGGDATPYQCNVLDGKAIPALVAACVKQYGGIDILVNNVGGGSPGGPITLSEENWDAQMNINLKTVFMMCKHVMPVMLEKGSGSIEYASKGIRINSVLPGQLHTPLVEVRVAKNQSGGDVQAILKRRQARIPMPFMGDGRDTANAALFLASDEARFITGTELIVDGGMTAKCD
jgi:NAD(P)-dependent dehydrogenase (short-subunit alcohol dehydrogenase family)